MNKADLVKAVAQKANLSKLDADKAVTALLEAIPYALDEGEKVTLYEFGTFKNVVRKAHVARNPATGELINIPEKTKKVFKFAKGV